MAGLGSHYCHKDERWIEKDLRGSPMVTVCPDCREEKLQKFFKDERKEVISYAEKRMHRGRVEEFCR